MDPGSSVPEAPEPSDRQDGWAEHLVTSMGGVSITYYRNGVIKRAYPGSHLTFTFPDGRMEEFRHGDAVPYPPPPGVEVALTQEAPQPFLRTVGSTLVRGFVMGVFIYLLWMAATILLL